ncbi:hypothetical protein CEXT_370531 [Caerostris extrusa]|uniref:Uncharacterized protein n=1 Tax=Caerostris extrusa TaxID=172846 RepID=A0AAV4NS71_CAEEX|nr:hypothetical protein CEXT_370531 [Caerostris extrusa]
MECCALFSLPPPDWLCLLFMSQITGVFLIHKRNASLPIRKEEDPTERKGGISDTDFSCPERQMKRWLKTDSDQYRNHPAIVERALILMQHEPEMLILWVMWGVVHPWRLFSRSFTFREKE